MLGIAALSIALLIPSVSDRVGETATAAPTIEVDGEHLVDEQRRPIQLRGVNLSGAEYSCVQGHGIFDGDVADEAVAAMASWQINTVRLPLNEDCWLGAPGLDPSSSGASYRLAIVDYVERLTTSGLVVMLDLHWTGTSDGLARGQQPMARSGRSAEFWRSVAGMFRHHDGIVFDAFNEPHDISWECWRDGCGKHAGMQDLVDAIRSTGARQPIVVSGLDWGGDLRSWEEFRPDDPQRALVAGAHLYDFKRCITPRCWDDEIAPVSASTPVVITEFGDSDCNGDFSRTVMNWADTAQVSYLAWTWNPWDCGGGPALISSIDGSATPYGRAIRDHFQARATPPDHPSRLPGSGFPI